MKPSSAPATPTEVLLGYFIWIIDLANRAEIEKTLASLSSIPFRFELILICKSTDIYVCNFIDTFLFKIVKKSITLHVPNDWTIEECIKLSSSFFKRHSPVYVYMVDGYTLNKETCQKFAITFLKDPKNDVLVFSEVSGGVTLFSPNTDGFVNAGFVFSKKDLTKLTECNIINVGSAEGKVERLTEGRKDPLLNPIKFNMG